MLPLSSAILLSLVLEHPRHLWASHEGRMPSSDVGKLFREAEVIIEQITRSILVALYKGNVCNRTFVANEPFTVLQNPI